MGSKAVSSGPLVDAISEWDVRESAANEEASLRGLRKKVGPYSVSRVLDSFENIIQSWWSKYFIVFL